MLKQLLQLDKDKEEEEAQVLDDEELNEILARNEEELELYTQIDREREAARRAEGRRGKPLPRLIDISELPPGLTMTAADNVAPVEEEELTETGRTKRKTRQLRPYSEDLLTEAQYLRIMENVRLACCWLSAWKESSPSAAAAQGEDLDEVLRKKHERRRRKEDNDADAASPAAETPPPSSSSRGGKRATPAADTYRAALGNVLNGILDHLEKVEEPCVSSSD